MPVIDRAATLAGGGTLDTDAARQRQERPSRKGAGQQVRSWDFRNPEKFSKEHLRSLLSLQQNFARLAGTALSGQLRTVVSLKVAVLEQGLYEEYVELLPERSLVCVVSLAPLDGQVMLEIPLGLANAMIERLLGGQDRPDALLERELTDIELALLSNLVQSLLDVLRDAWQDAAELQPVLQSITSSRRLGQIVPPSDSVLIAFFDVQMGPRIGALTLCIPHLVLDPVMQTLAAQGWKSTGRLSGQPTAAQSQIERHLRRTKVPVTAVLGETELTAEELAGLQVGDLLLLGMEPRLTARLRVVNRYLYAGRPGLVGSRVAVQIERIEEDADGHG